ncbi:MAG: hypothetical protein ABH882_04235, partial [Candidatus Omnitrophota bacterium]
PMPAYNLEGALSFLVTQLNSRYDKRGVIFLGLLKLIAKIGWPLKKVTNKWQKDRDYFCSELCYSAFDEGGGLDIVPDVPEADITSPGDIAKSSLIELIEER